MRLIKSLRGDDFRKELAGPVLRDPVISQGDRHPDDSWDTREPRLASRWGMKHVGFSQHLFENVPRQGEISTSIRPIAAGLGGSLPPIRRLSIIRTSRKGNLDRRCRCTRLINHWHSLFCLFINNNYPLEDPDATPLPFRFLLDLSLRVYSRDRRRCFPSNTKEKLNRKAPFSFSLLEGTREPLPRTSPLSVSHPLHPSLLFQVEQLRRRIDGSRTRNQRTILSRGKKWRTNDDRWSFYPLCQWQSGLAVKRRTRASTPRYDADRLTNKPVVLERDRLVWFYI